MLLVIDAGNTNTVFALYEGEAPAHIWRIRADQSRTSDEYASWLAPLMGQAGLKLDDITDVVIGSVVPSANFHLTGLCDKYLKCTPMFIGQTGTDHGVPITFPNAHMVGADLIANVLAARTHYKTPMIVIDFGTATKFLVLDRAGSFIGAVIAPGVNLSVEALHNATAQLPKIDVVKPATVIGTDTIGCMRSGIFWGYVSMIEGMVARMSAEMNDTPDVIITGGLAPIFGGSIKGVDKTDPNLTIEGMRLYHARNKDKKAVAA